MTLQSISPIPDLTSLGSIFLRGRKKAGGLALSFGWTTNSEGTLDRASTPKICSRGIHPSRLIRSNQWPRISWGNEDEGGKMTKNLLRITASLKKPTKEGRIFRRANKQWETAKHTTHTFGQTHKNANTCAQNTHSHTHKTHTHKTHTHKTHTHTHKTHTQTTRAYTDKTNTHTKQTQNARLHKQTRRRD